MTLSATIDDLRTAALRELPAARTDPASLRAARTDRSGTTAEEPLAVVAVADVDHVRAALRWAHHHGVAVVPRGAGTGLAGGALARGRLVLDLSGLRTITALDAVERTARVEPGVLTADLDAAAAAHGLMYAPDPASAAISTIGGNIATNAGGMRCVKYGVTRDAVLALDVVLADGRLIHTGRATAKGVVGYDLTSLFVGSEGTLGVVVGATVRLLPRPARTATVLAAFPDIEAAARACSAVIDAQLTPSLLELIDRRTLQAVAEHTGTDPTGVSDAGAAVVAQADGAHAEDEAASIGAALRAYAVKVETTADPTRTADLLAARRLALPAIEARAHALIEDICVPRSRLADAVRGIEAISADTGVDVFTFAHAGDGNLHPIVTWPRTTHGTIPDLRPAEVDAAAGRIFELAVRLGGTLSGEHGIGTLKRAYLGLELSSEVLDVQHTLKAALDPRGILNPATAI